MGTILKLLLFVSISISCVLSQLEKTPIGTTGISAVSASSDVYHTAFAPYCLSSANQNYRSFPSGQSVENFIALVERLENVLANTTDSNLMNHKGAEKVARLLLRRFRFDGYDVTATPSFQKQRDQSIDRMNNAFLGIPEPDPNLYFPDYVYKREELCSLFIMLSHNIINSTDPISRSYAPSVFRGRVKRQSYQYNNNNRRQNNPIGQDNTQRPGAYPFLATRNTVPPIKEEGVVSFRGNKNEAIAIARVLIGVIAGLTQNILTSTAAVAKAYNGKIIEDKQIDPVIAMTIADLWGSGITVPGSNEEKTYYYGLSGEWASTLCTTYYGFGSVPNDKFIFMLQTNKGTKAEIRGGIDGYLIGKALRGMGTIDSTKLRLSTILRSYYSRPRISKTSSLTVSYCNRNQQLPNDLQSTAQTYSVIYGSTTSQLLQEFSTALASAQAMESTGFSDYCTIPSLSLDKNAPCETPSDVIFIIDGQTADKLQISGDIVTSVSGNLNNIRTQGGTVSIFFNSNQKTNPNPDIQLPSGPGEWPLTVASFNSTNTGCSSCRINDFNTSLPTPFPNTVKYFLSLNQTLFNYEWWTPRTNFSAVPGKTAILIDLGSMAAAPDSGQDRSDYNNYKDQLRYRHRDVRYLSVATNQDLFKDILRDDTDKDTPGTVGSPNLNIGPSFAKKICENPAIFQYNDCNRRSSDNVQYVGYVTPGYRQNWAMYPEFFLKSFNIKFSFKAEDGDIKVCFDRIFPPERNDEYYCKELKSGEEKLFEISNPCKGESFNSCKPFYFTVWGKDRTQSTQCLDDRCASLDQIKFTVTHSGVQCNSSTHLLPSTTFQVIILFISAILYLSLTNNKS